MASAETIVPILTRLLNPGSVVDVGCGRGEWLDAFRRQGITDFQGIDAFSPEAVDLLVARERIAVLDLEQPFDLGRRFDLVVCLEVAEHLSPTAAERFIGRLTAHGDAVAFSAAIPGQGGTGHRNEQWLEYWIALFERHGFRAFDVVRPLIWDRDEVAAYYRQNLVVFATAGARDKLTTITPTLADIHVRARSLVHPETFRGRLIASESPKGLRHALRMLYLEIGCRFGFASPPVPPYPEYAPATVNIPGDL